MLQLMNNFHLTNDFLYWLAGDKLEQRFISEHVYDKLSNIIIEYYIDGALVSIGKGQYLLSHPTGSLLASYFASKTDKPFKAIDKNEIQKRKIVQKQDGSTYTIFSHLYHKEMLFGVGTEILYLENLIEVYQKRNGSLS